MTLMINGTIYILPACCEKCGQALSIFQVPQTTIKCYKCGALYEVMKTTNDDRSISVECEFNRFECIYNKTAGGCGYVCPAPNMFCMAHLTDENYDQVRNNIKYYEDVIKELKDTLVGMDEAKKIWLIQEMSGLEK